MTKEVRIVYCHCAYADVVPKPVKEAVLRRLSDSGVEFDAVADLCEMSAQRDPALKQYAGCGGLRIAACYPRAVRNLFLAVDAPLPETQVRIANMRTTTADEVLAEILDPAGAPEVQT